MKILHLIQRPQLRGAEIFACQLAAELIQLGVEVDMLFLFGTDKLPFNLNFLHLEANESKRWWDFASYKKLNEIIRTAKYDVVQANAGDTLKYASISKKLHGWKAKIVFRNANKISDFLNSSGKKLINSWLVSQVVYVASVSDECKKDFELTFDYNHDRIGNLPIGVNIGGQTAALKDLSVFGISQKGPIFLSVASFVKEKNHQGLLRIFKEVLENYPGAALILIGEGNLKAETIQQAANLGIHSAVYFLGRRNDVQSIMPLCDLMLLPSLIEGLPAVILEAFVNRLPVIAYNVGGIPEVVKNNETGWLVNKGDEAAFVSGVCKALKFMPSQIEEMKNNAEALVKDKYDNKKIALRFLKVYQKIIAIKTAE